jgi:uncharacterized RDD family membrane protein YckC
MQDSMAQGGGAVSEETVSADFLTRFLAILIDGLILMVPLVIAFLVLPVALYYVLSLVVGAGYNVYFWSTTGQTIGKKVMGLKVVSAETGQILGVQGAVIRYVCTIVSSIPLGLGYFWALWDPKHDTWHDKLAKTKVISVK